MAATLRSATELTSLTPTEKRVAEKIAAGLSNQEAAAELRMQPGTLGRHIMNIGLKFGVSSRPAKVHAALASGQAPASEAPDTVPDFTEDELLLLRAVATKSDNDEIAAAARIAPALVTTRIRNLANKAGALNSSHLVGIAHAWQLLNSETTTNRGTSASPPPAMLPDHRTCGGTQ